MKDKIQTILNNSPKHYTRIISSNAELDTWVKTNSNTTSDHYPTMIYCAMHDCTTTCKYGKERKISRYSEGLVNCGPSNSCQCTKESIATNVSKAKLEYTEEKKKLVQDKREQTMLSKFGYAFNGQRPEVKVSLSKPKIPLSAVEKLTDLVWLNEEYNIKGRNASDIANELGIYYSTVIEYCKKFNFTIRRVTNYSKEETEIGEFIKSLGFEVITNSWDIADGKEIDIFVPAKKLAIELNGIYWHSYHPSSFKTEDKMRHIEKTLLCEGKGIDLLHITDIEWNTKQSIIKSIIMSKLGLNTRVYARQCTVQLFKNNEVKDFLNQYHIQGYVPAKYNVGLVKDDKLLMLMTFGNSRFNSAYEFELLRMASVSGITVVAGISKIMKYLRTALLISSPIISYCDRSKSAGKGYISSGFDLVGETKPGYAWTDNKDMISRFRARTPNMHKLLNNYDPSLTIDQNMFNGKYRRYWDCGNFIFEYKS